MHMLRACLCMLNLIVFVLLCDPQGDGPQGEGKSAKDG